MNSVPIVPKCIFTQYLPPGYSNGCFFFSEQLSAEEPPVRADKAT